MKMALAYTGLVQKVMEKVAPQLWAMRLDKVTPVPKSRTQCRPIETERSDGALRCAPTPWLGLIGLTVTPDVALAMNLASGQHGVLVEELEQHGPADQAHLQAGSQAFVSHGHRRLIGGDVIVALDGQAVSQLKDVRTLLQRARPGQAVTLTLLQGEEQRQVSVTIGQRSASILSPSLQMLQHRPSFPAQPPGHPKGVRPAQAPPGAGDTGRTPLGGGDSDLAGATF
jgi:predicted metalloprotease with PDZ domain